jgi:hypothetical protein
MHTTKIILAGLLSTVFMSAAMAAPITVTFDDAVGTYTPTPGFIHDVKNEFASLGFIFEDVANPTKGATLGKCGPGSGAVALFGYGNDYSGCGKTTPNMNILFVDPTNSTNAGFTTSFSLYDYDGLIEATAYDVLGNVLGSTQAYTGYLSFSGIGQISKINLFSLDNDATTLDTLTFEAVKAVRNLPEVAPVPEPSALALLAIGLMGFMFSRRKAK